MFVPHITVLTYSATKDSTLWWFSCDAIYNNGMKITILEPDEQIEAVYSASVSQNKTKLSTLRGGEFVPISYDVLDYISCDGVASHRATVYDHDDDGYDYGCTHYAKAIKTVSGDSPDDIDIHEPDEDPDVRYKTVSQLNHSTLLSTMRPGGWVPLAYDALDAVTCDGVVTHKERLSLGDGDVYDTNCTHIAIADNDADADADLGTDILEPDETYTVKYRSSISQHREKLSVLQGGEWVPLSYDALDYISCDGIGSHRETVSDTADIGYDFSVRETKYYTDKYIYHDDQHIELRTMDSWFGAGQYEAYVNDHKLINTDDGSLGLRTVSSARIGTAYALADETLEPDD